MLERSDSDESKEDTERMPKDRSARFGQSGASPGKQAGSIVIQPWQKAASA